MSTLQKIVFALKLYRTVPAYLFRKYAAQKDIIEKDLRFWQERKHLNEKNTFVLYSRMLLEAEGFRDVVHMRLKKGNPIMARIFKMLFPLMETLHLGSGEIGPGLYIQHGFSTIVAAKSVGENCWINQQVTIGFEQDRQPVIGNHVRVCAGAIIIGDVTVGDNSIIAAGAVVTKDVPPGEIWGGVPAKFLKKVKGSSFDDQAD